MEEVPPNVRDFSKSIGILARVTAYQGNLMMPIAPIGINQRTGVITMPDFLGGWKTLSKITDPTILKDRMLRDRDKLPSHFTLEVAHRTGDRVIVVQREKGDRYRASSAKTEIGELTVHTEPPCGINARIVSDQEMKEQGVPRLSIWLDTQMQDQRGSNRADVIRITKEGVVTLHRVLVLYLDGEFRVVQELGWKGEAYHRSSRTPYVLASKDPRILLAFSDDEVRKLLNEFVFVPDFGFPSIEKWLQMLLIPAFQTLVRSSELDEWDGVEDFWLEPSVKVAMTGDDQAVLEWFVYGTGGAGMGYARFNTPMQFKGRTVTNAQLRHHTTQTVDVDRQGLKRLRAGSILKIHRLIDMDVGGKRYDPLAVVSVQYSFDEGSEDDPLVEEE